MFSLNAESEPPSNEEVEAQMQKWGLTSSHTIGLNDPRGLGMKTYFPGVEGWRGAMLLSPGFKVVKTGLTVDDLERELDAALTRG